MRISKDDRIKSPFYSKDEPSSEGSSVSNAYQRIVQVCRKMGDLLSKSPIKTVVRIAATGIFVIFVNRSIEKSDLVRLAGQIHIIPVACAFILGAGSFFFQMLRWRLILESYGFPCSLMVSLKTMFRGCLLAFITPGRIGELFRAVHIDGKRHTAAMVAVIEERSFGVVMTVVAGLVCLFVQAALYEAPPFIPVVIPSLVVLIACAGVIAAMYKGEAFLNATTWFSARSGRLIDYLHRIRSLPFLQLTMLSIGAHLLLLLQTALLFQMFGSGDFGRNLVAAGQAFSFMLLLPFFIANIGLREYSFTLFLTRLSLPSDIAPKIGTIALGAATSILFINIILPAAIGLIWIYIDKKAATEPDKVHEAHAPYSIADRNKQECHDDTSR